jgi:hypothetical protein
MKNLVHIHTFSYRHEAELARSMLEANAIPSVIHADDAGGQGIGIQFTRGVHLFVRAEDADRANALLEGNDS